MTGLLAFLYVTTLLFAQAGGEGAAPAKGDAAKAPAAENKASEKPAQPVAEKAAPATGEKKAPAIGDEPAAEETTDETAPAEKPGGGGITDMLFSTYALPLGAMLLLMYFMLLRPEQKKRKEVEQTLGNLKKNDHIVTIGGICGTVVNISPNSTYITIRVDESNNTRLKILRSAVARVGQVEDQDNKIEPKKESA